MSSYVNKTGMNTGKLDEIYIGKIIIDGAEVFIANTNYSITGSTGTDNAYTNTSSTATSSDGKTSYPFGTTVYGFIHTANGSYYSGGTALGTEGYYRVGSFTADGRDLYNFGTFSRSGTISINNMTSSCQQEITIETTYYRYTWSIYNPNSFAVTAKFSGATTQTVTIAATSFGSVSYTTTLGKNYTEYCYFTYSGGRTASKSKTQGAS